MTKRKVDMLTEKLEIGRRYKIKYIAGQNNKQGTSRFEGVLIKKMDKYLIFRSVLGYTECFLKVDFVIGQYRIEEVV